MELTEDFFNEMLDGTLPEAEIERRLRGLADCAVTAEGLALAASALRARMIRFVPPPLPRPAMDLCGTGGDGLSSYNISTTAAFVVAACGQPVIKHGNRAVSSISGSTDVLSALGIAPSGDHERLAAQLGATGLTFLAAPHFHPALKRLAPIRAKIGRRTLFNLLGPLCNPAGVTRQLLGLYDGSLLKPMARALRGLGALSAWVVAGADGMDELSISGESHCAAIAQGEIRHFNVNPVDASLGTHPLETLRGGDASHNAEALTALLGGARDILPAYRSAVLLNSAAALVISGVAADLTAGAAIADDALASGKALTILRQMQELSH